MPDKGISAPKPAKAASEEGVKAIACTSCGGALTQGERAEGSGEDREEIPIAKCVSCGKEYDRHTREYYEFFADTFITDKDDTVFKLGTKGSLDGVEYEIIGRIRYQEEDEYELSTWDEWLAINTSDGSYHWFLEEEGNIFIYSDYVPRSVNLEAAHETFEFEGRSITKKRGFVARIVYHEGELTWRPETGEPMTVYDFKIGGAYYTIERSEDEVSISRGMKLAYKTVLGAFRKDEYRERYESTMKTRKAYRSKAWLYLAMCAAAFGLMVKSCVSGAPLEGVAANRIVLTDNAKMSEQEQGTVYYSEVLSGPVTLDDPENLYGFGISIDQTVQPLSREWQSFRVMLIAADRLKALAPAIDAAHAKELKDALDDIEFQPEPVESYVFQGDFWDETGTDSEGDWHESDTSLMKNFVLPDTGEYYIHVTLYGGKPRKTEAFTMTMYKGQKSALYFLGACAVFLALMIINWSKARKYNELPFAMND